MSITGACGPTELVGIPRDRAAASMLSERVGQLASLQGLFAECLRGDSRIAIVDGAVGSGKTELLNAFSAQVAGSGAQFLEATAARVERTVPFGVLAHLLHSVHIDDDLRSRASLWVEEAQSLLLSRFLLDGTADEVAPQTFHGMCMTLLDIVERSRGPLVIGIDDVQYADVSSLKCLSFIVRRLRSARLLVVLNGSLHSGRPTALSEAELPPEPLARFVSLPLLSPQGVQDVMSAHLGDAVARATAAEAYAVSGGNPLLLRGLIEDNRGHALPGLDPELRVDNGFRQALIACLFRCEPEILHVARRLAVLDEACSVSQLAQMAGLDTVSIRQALGVMQETGLLSGGLLRHPQACAAVLSGMTSDERADLQIRTANVLFKTGASVVTVASQIIAADRIDTDCVIPVLHEAAEQSLADGNAEFALDSLRLAHQHDTDDRRRATTTAMLIRAAWRTEPYAAFRRVPALIADFRAGRLAGWRVSAGVDAMLWFGQPAEAAELIEHRSVDALDVHDTRTASHLGASFRWLRAMYPGWAADDTGESAVAWLDSASPELGARRRAASMFRDILTEGPDPATVAEARRALRHHALGEDTMWLLLVSVHTLMYAEQLRDAHDWAERLAAEAKRQSAVVWEAFFHCAVAEILLRQGEPKLAEEQVDRALVMLPARNWGIALALPLSTALQASALTAGDSAVVRDAQPLIPSAVFETPLGMRLLIARGHRALASGQAAAALDDFLAVGEIVGRWRMDNPVVVPWRSGAALACIRLGDLARARALAAEEVRRCGPRHPRVYAAALRVLAACGGRGGAAVELLGKAADSLRVCEAPLELSFVLYDMGWALQEQGQYSKGRLMLRQSRLMAEESGVQMPVRIAPGADEHQSSPEATAQQEDVGTGSLSEAELRVAHRAMSGHSNRQIASQLFVTVSTVEQHLTRIYRKLNIKRRTDLALAIQTTGSADSPRAA
ncbi:AAA family ATPase [Streptomyces sp. NPDC056452]|uniref:helix-turn-helix transcriptional regulator n=1 Tax=Streptomyces sp. NPDC056452 TaxID=3345821 RepID=UPI0036ACEE4E